MGGFSYGRAVTAGFRLVGRHPLAVLNWAVAYLVFVALPIFVILAYALPQIVAGYQESLAQAAHHLRPDPARMMALRSRMFSYNPLIWLISLTAHAVFMGAVFRAWLEPGDSRFGYLRLGARELWLGLTYLVLAVMGVILLFTLFIPMAIAIGISAATSGHGGPGLPATVLLCAIAAAGVGAVAWVELRLSLALPMSFAQRRFVLYESWDLTRGQALKMAGVVLSLVLLIVLVELVFVSVLGFSLRSWLVGFRSWDGLPHATLGDILRAIGPLVMAIAAVAVMAGTVIQVILVTPLAEIWRELSGAEPAPAA
jgi:hypothetical protein